MIKRPFCGMAASFLLGVIAASRGAGAVSTAAALVWLAAALRQALTVRDGRRQKDTRFRAAVRMSAFALCLLFGSFRYGQECRFRSGYLPGLRDGAEVTVQGRLDKKEIKNQQYIYEMASCIIGCGQDELSKEAPVPCNRILVYTDSDFASVGEILVLNGTIQLWSTARNEGNFDEKSFYQNRKIDFALRDVRLCGTYGKENRLAEGLFALKNRMRALYEQTLEGPEAGVLCAMALGDKTLLWDGQRQMYQNCGLSHIMAISGLHVAVVGMACYGFLKKFGPGLRSACAVSAFLLVCYAQMTGMGNSARRAVFMFCLLLSADIAGRSYDTLNALGAAAFFLLVQNPYLPWDAGFQFSFTAVAGIVCMGKCVDFSEQKYGKWAQKIYAGTTAWLVTLPLAVWHSYEAACYAVPVNLIVLPMTGAVLTTGLSGGLLGTAAAALFGEHAGLALADVLLLPCEKILWLINGICGAAGRLPGAVRIAGRLHFLQVILCYAGLAALAFYLRRRAQTGKRKPAAGDLSTAGKRWAAGQSARFCAGAAVVLVMLFWRAGSGTELDFLDVGQGDGSFLRTGGGDTVFVDGGSTGAGKVGIYRILPFLKYRGVRKIDYWFVSHTDEDHISGLRELLEEGYPVRHLVFSGTVRTREDAALDGLLALAAENGCGICYVDAGDILHLGEAQIQVLAPACGAVYADKNAASLVLRYEEGEFSGIFTGDIGRAEEELLAASGALRPVTFYKAAHHGSKYSNSEGFLQALSPEISVISCGENNRYGHPGEEAVRNMERAGSRIFETMHGGQIKIRYRRGQILAETYCGSKEGCVFGEQLLK